VLTTRRYDVFGNLELGAANGYAFTGREWDGETGLYYYRARYYDPKTGRFINEDPVGLSAGLNLYRYVHNRPTTHVDPAGLYEVKGFPAGLGGGNVNQAIQTILNNLPKLPPAMQAKIRGIIEDPDLVIEYDPIMRDACGATPILSAFGFRSPKVVVGPLAWNCCYLGQPAGDTSLASVILHELTHNAGYPLEWTPEQNEQKCFSCSAGPPPPTPRPMPAPPPTVPGGI
jgi:RHS repeat-associated protein